MPQTSLSLQLRGGTILQDRTLQERTIGMSGGAFATGNYPAVDVTGYYILPGIIDLHNDGLDRHNIAPAERLIAADRSNAAAGITTSWLTCRWSLPHSATPAEHALKLMAACLVLKPRLLTRQHIRIEIERLAIENVTDIIEALDAHEIRYVSFADDLSLQAAETDTVLANSMHKQVCDPTQFLDDLRSRQEKAREVPRRLCALAEHFDSKEILYGSTGDRDGETRETYSMLGAKLCDRPGAGSAASIANAVGDPVILTADMVLRETGPVSARALIHSGRCAALGSGTYPEGLTRALFQLVEAGVLPLSRAWSLVSEQPAKIMRIADRGTIEHGKRADLTIVNKRTREVEATFRDGILIYLCGELAERLIAAQLQDAIPATSRQTTPNVTIW